MSNRFSANVPVGKANFLENSNNLYASRSHFHIRRFNFYQLSRKLLFLRFDEFNPNFGTKDFSLFASFASFDLFFPFSHIIGPRRKKKITCTKERLTHLLYSSSSIQRLGCDAKISFPFRLKFPAFIQKIIFVVFFKLFPVEKNSYYPTVS